MKQIQMEAKLRTAQGKGPVGRLRREQKLVPAVLNARGESSVNLEVSPKEFQSAIHTSAGTNVLIKLEITGGEAARQETVMVKAIQRHPVTAQLVHVDFVKINLDKPLETHIPVLVSGTAPGIKEGGILEQVHRELAIRCLPSLIPENVTVDVSSLMIGDGITVADLILPEGVEVLVSSHEPVVHVVAPKAEEEVKPAEAAIAGAPVPGAPVAGTEAAAAEVKQPEVIGEKEREARRLEKEKGKSSQKA